jgi:DNA-binding FrmR family transcriptional regulator
MQLADSQIKQNIQHRLNRIEGQVRGISDMVQRESDCQEVLRQLNAARAALDSTTRVFLESVVKECSNSAAENPLSQQEITTQLLEMITKK